MSSPTALPALPGASSDPGSGPVEPALLDGLIDDGVLDTNDPAVGLPAHRALLASAHRDLAASLLVPASAASAAALREALTPQDAGIRVVLHACGPDPLTALRAARAELVDVDGVEMVGIRLPIPAEDDGDDGPPAATHRLLAQLDSSVPAWIIVPPGRSAEPVIDVLVADGAEYATLDGTTTDHLAVAGVLRHLVDRDLSFRVAGAPGVLGTERPGLLNVLCATRAALNGAEPDELARILAATDAAPLTSALRRMSAADAAVLRAFLVAVEVPDATVAAGDLDRLGLLPVG